MSDEFKELRDTPTVMYDSSINLDDPENTIAMIKTGPDGKKYIANMQNAGDAQVSSAGVEYMEIAELRNNCLLLPSDSK